MLSIVTFKWGSKYTDEHVYRLGSMLARNLTIPFEYVLITDTPENWTTARRHTGAPRRVIRLWDEMRDAKLCGVRLKMFDPNIKLLFERFAWIDLDVVITGNVDQLFSRTESFVALATPRRPMPYNGSLVMMNAGCRPSVYTEWSLSAYRSRGEAYGRRMGVKHGTVSDEGWMAEILGHSEARFELASGIEYYKNMKRGQDGKTILQSSTKLVIMNGRRFDPAFPALQAESPWIKTFWR